MLRVLLLAAVGGFLFLAPGCEKSDPFTYVKVSGSVTYEDGSALPGQAALGSSSFPSRRRWTRRPIPASA